MPEVGGWEPADVAVRVGEPLQLRLTSRDVVHGFAVGRLDEPSRDVKPGEVTDVTLVFEEAGTYTFYCTRWCGPDHWRMRGTITVVDSGFTPPSPTPPLYLQLGLDLDNRPDATVRLARKPSAARGAALGVGIADRYSNGDSLRRMSPLDILTVLEQDPAVRHLSEIDLWDLVAVIWQRGTTSDALATGRALYSRNCAACHGESGAGDGVMARHLASGTVSTRYDRAELEFGSHLEQPADFTDPRRMLGARPALLQGKILRGGMGTGMPYWGSIFTDQETWALVDFLWTFQFDFDIEGIPR